MADPQPQLPPTSAANLSSSIRAILLMMATVEAIKGATWLVSHGYIENSDVAEFVSVTTGAIIAAATLGWSYLQNHFNGRKIVAAAATGNPGADPADPKTKAAVSAAINNSLSPITAKPQG
jgi:ABC-type phosphate transport system substrate-binding protein